MKTRNKIILAVVSLILSRLIFTLINDPEGPNLLIVTILGAIIYSLFLVICFLYKRLNIKMKNTEKAFKWIVNILNKNNIPYQISGGFAARLYGSNRELADIDIGIPDEGFNIIYSEVKDYIIYGPKHYLDDEWDLKLMTLKYENQKIDLAGRDSIKIFDKLNKKWIPAHRDMTLSENKEVYGIIVPVIPKASLIAYKKKIMRKVDIEDIKNLEASL